MYPSSRRNVMKGPLLHLLEYLTLLRHQFFLHVSAYLPSHALPSINELFALKEERMLKDMALTTKAFVSNKLTFEALLRSLQVDKQDWKCNTNYQRNFDIKHMPSLCIDYSGILSSTQLFPYLLSSFPRGKFVILRRTQKNILLPRCHSCTRKESFHTIIHESIIDTTFQVLGIGRGISVDEW